MTRRSQIVTLVAAALATAAFAPATTSAGTKKKPKVKVATVKVADDFYAPVKLKLKAGSKVKWVWDSENFDSHNVTLLKGPKGVAKSKYKSATGTTGIRFERALTKPGTYHFYCTLHPDSMNLTIVVKR